MLSHEEPGYWKSSKFHSWHSDKNWTRLELLCRAVLRRSKRNERTILRCSSSFESEIVTKAFYIHCYAHKLNLVIASCVESVGTVGSFFSLVQTLYTFISNSNTRHQLFVEAQKAAELPVLELGRSAATRWSYWYRSISKVRLRYECILAVLSAVSEGANGEARAEAAGLQKKMESFLVIFQLHYIEAIMRATNSLSQQLQAVDLVISRSRTLIQATRSELTDLRSDRFIRIAFREG